MIPFNKPYMTGKELEYISQAHNNRHLSGDGEFTKRCHGWLENYSPGSKALLTHSCTAALEMSALLLDIKNGDEIIMPSFTFVSTANAFVLRGGVPVFVDIRKDTLNLDDKLIEKAITPRTRAIVAVHYAGVACDLDNILAIADKYNLAVIEDAAQSINSSYKGKVLGGIGHLGCLSFHETKNVICGEGGALLINDPQYFSHAEIIREKGTNRSQFHRGEVDKYTWQSIGSSFLPSELNAAFLLAQLEHADELTARRIQLWENYHRLLESAENKGLLRRPIVLQESNHNAHMYYIILPEYVERQTVLTQCKQKLIDVLFHYVPLHSSPAGKKYCRTSGELINTLKASSQIIRLPLWLGLNEEQQKYIVDTLINSINNL